MYTGEQIMRFADAFLKYNEEPVELDPWQEMLLADQGTYIILLKGRQEGFSFAVAAKKFIELQSPDVKNKTVQFVSYNLMDAVEKIRYVSIMAHSIPEKRRKKIAYETKTSIEFLDAGGRTTSRLVSIACRPPRGKPGDVVLDEFAIYGLNRQELIYTAALPSITRGGSITVGSTPLGKLGLFHDIYADRKKYGNYTRYTVPWWQARELCRGKDIMGPRAANVKDMDTEQRVRLWGSVVLRNQFAVMDIESFQQEYECAFLDNAGSYISLELIHENTPGMRECDTARQPEDGGEEEDLEIHAAKSLSELYGLYDRETHGTLYLGYDVARRRDAAVVFAVGYSKGIKRSLADIEMRNTPFEEQLNVIMEIMECLPVVRCCMDMTGMGEPLYEQLHKKYGDRIEGVPFTAETKEIMAVSVRRGLENREFLLQNDRAFHHQIHSIRRESTGTGRFRYDAERTEKGHADSFWAWALANYAITADGSRGPNFYEQWAAKKNSALTQTGGTGGMPAAAVPVTGRRGKPLNSVLGGIARGYEK